MAPLRHLLVAAMVTVCAGFAPPGTADAGSASELARAFFRVVFGLEYGSSHSDSHRVKKYVGQVRFFVEDLSSRDRRPAASRFLAALPNRISHLKSAVVRREADANFRVFLVDRDDFNRVVEAELRADAMAMGARCLVGVKTRGGEIVSSTAIIVADDDYLFQRCLVEEVLQGLGPMNDSPELSESVFNDRSSHTKFTAFDQALLNILYHPSIRPGMTGTEVQRTLPRVMLDLGYTH